MRLWMRVREPSMATPSQSEITVTSALHFFTAANRLVERGDAGRPLWFSKEGRR